MKKINIINGLVLFIAISNFVFAKEIYVDQSMNEKYLFLGSIDGKQKKYLALKTKEIKWIPDTDIKQQIDQLTPEDYYRKIIKSGLIFNAEGSEPFWSATLTKNKLNISLSGEKKQELPIDITIDKNPLDGVFILMFESQDKGTYGIIRMLSQETLCDISLVDEESVFEVFINNKGRIVKGCSQLDLAS